AALFKKSQVFVGKEATEDRYKRLAPHFDLIHLATHGLADDAQPLYSFLLLSPSENPRSGNDGLLQACEIAEQKLKARLVVLSASDTGYGRLSKGEGVLGLASRFLQAGARAAMVSLWWVEGESTALLMPVFYRNLAAGMEMAEALRAAKRTLLRQTHPFALNKI